MLDSPSLQQIVFSFLHQLSMWHCPLLLLHTMLQCHYCWVLGSNWSISPASRALSSKPTAVVCSGQMMGWQTDGHWPVHRPCSEYYSSSANNTYSILVQNVWIQKTSKYESQENRQGGALEVILTLSDDDKKSNQPVNTTNYPKTFFKNDNPRLQGDS